MTGVVSITLQVDHAAMAQLQSWEGPCGQDSRRRLDTLEFRARNSAGISTPNPTRPTPGGALRMSIRTEIKPINKPGTLEATVGSNRPYAAAHHEGAKRHKIVPRASNPSGLLRFWWGRVGAIVYRKSVNHPGNRPNPYLTRWLREAVR